MSNTNIEMNENSFYHIFNYGNNLDNIFYEKENYLYFLKKFDFYLSEFLDVYSFCLLTNQFHFLVKVKKNEVFLNDSNLRNKDNDTKIKKILMQERFRIFFMSYSKSFNKKYNRNGSLFQKNFRKQKIENTSNLQKFVLYIHYLPQLNNITSNFREYQFSSYNRFITDKISKIKKEEVLKWFSGKQNFIEYHNDFSNIENLLDKSTIGLWKQTFQVC